MKIFPIYSSTRLISGCRYCSHLILLCILWIDIHNPICLLICYYILVPEDFKAVARCWHPLKGSCQQKTPHHRKRDTFFCRDKFSSALVLFYLLPIILKTCYAESVNLLTGTHQDQGQRAKTSHLRSEEAIKPRSGIIVLLCSPWSEIGPQKKIGTLPKPMGCYKTWGSFRASHRELLTRADQKDIYLKIC